MYTQMQPGQATARQQAAPTGRHLSPPVTSRPLQRRANSGCVGWFLVVFLLVAIIAVAGAIALSNAGVFGKNGLFGNTPSTTTPRTSAPVTITTTQQPAPQPSPTPSPTPTPTIEPTPPTSELPPPPDLNDMLDSITSEFNSLIPQPGLVQEQGAPPQAFQGQGAPGNVDQGRGGER